MIITIDGPTASGKSSTADLIARQLGFHHLNSGLFYRALAYLLMTQRSYTLEQLYHPHETDINKYLNPSYITYQVNDQGKGNIIVDGHDITSLLKTNATDQPASIISLNPQIRSLVNGLMRNVASRYNLVADGRDCGSVVFPQAELKIFLTASLPVRAQRWQQVHHAQGLPTSQVLAQLEERDKRDMTRAVAPLVIPPEAIVIDNSSLRQQETVDQIVGLAQTIINK